MPYLKQKQKPFEGVRRLLLGYEITPVKLNKILGVCYNTARDRIDSPERLTLADMRKIHRYGHVPADVILDAIGKEL